MSTATLDQPETVIEHTTSRGIKLSVDREAGVIRGVKILGTESKNGRTYKTEAIIGAVHLYEGSKVNVNHPRGDPRAPRDYGDRLGRLESVQAHADGLYGDLHFNPKHALAEQLLWDAEHAPENVGLSHNVTARMSRKDGKTVVEEITSVVSVDVVADPATTKGLFESTSPITDTTEDSIVDLSKTTLTEFQAARPDLVESIGKTAVTEATEAIGKAALAAQADGEEAKAQTAELAKLKEQVAVMEAEKTSAAKKTARDTILTEAKLPEEYMTETFTSLVHEATDDEKAKALVEEIKRIAKLAPAKTRSQEQEGLTEGKGTGIEGGKATAAALTSS